MAHMNRRPAHPTRLIKKDGDLTWGPKEAKATSHEHFYRALNIPSQYSQAVLDAMPSLPPAMELDQPPTFENLVEALGKLKQGKPAERTGILLKLLLHGGAERTGSYC